MNNNDSLAKLYNAAQSCAAKFLACNFRQVVLLHHNDCDGLCSGSILDRTLQRLHIKVLRYCLEKPYPLALKEIFDNQLLDESSAFLFTDFASGMLSILDQLNQNKRPIFVIDHHQVDQTWSRTSSEISLLNCREFNINGSIDCSASSLAYMFAEQINQSNQDLVALAVIGAAGDGQYDSNYSFTGVNQVNYKKAIDLNLIDNSNRLSEPHELDIQELVAALNALGSFAYFSNGVDIALKGLAEGFDQRYLTKANEAQHAFEQVYSNFKKSLQLNEAEKLQWFILNQDFVSFGVKSVGLICERLLAENFAKQSKVLLGFQKIPEQIPGLSDTYFNEYKVSLRLSNSLRSGLSYDSIYNLAVLLPNAINKLGGFVDACHTHAAAATIKIGQELQLVDILDQQLRGQ